MLVAFRRIIRGSAAVRSVDVRGMMRTGMSLDVSRRGGWEIKHRFIEACPTAVLSKPSHRGTRQRVAGGNDVDCGAGWETHSSARHHARGIASRALIEAGVRTLEGTPGETTFSGRLAVYFGAQ